MLSQSYVVSGWAVNPVTWVFIGEKVSLRHIPTEKEAGMSDGSGDQRNSGVPQTSEKQVNARKLTGILS